MKAITSFSIEDFFKEKSSQLHLFKTVNDFVDPIHPIQIKISKSQISLANKRQLS